MVKTLDMQSRGH